jgi:hypothetical protein
LALNWLKASDEALRLLLLLLPRLENTDIMPQNDDD